MCIYVLISVCVCAWNGNAKMQRCNLNECIFTTILYWTIKPFWRPQWCSIQLVNSFLFNFINAKTVYMIVHTNIYNERFNSKIARIYNMYECRLLFYSMLSVLVIFCHLESGLHSSRSCANLNVWFRNDPINYLIWFDHIVEDCSFLWFSGDY